MEAGGSRISMTQSYGRSRKISILVQGLTYSLESGWPLRDGRAELFVRTSRFKLYFAGPSFMCISFARNALHITPRSVAKSRCHARLRSATLARNRGPAPTKA